MAGNRGWWGAVVAAVLLVGLTVISLPSVGVVAPQPGPAEPTTLTAAERPPPPDLPTGGAAALLAHRTAEVAALLDRRADAVRRRDLPEFMADIDPAGDPRFRAAQRTMFDNLGAVDSSTAAAPDAESSRSGGGNPATATGPDIATDQHPVRSASPVPNRGTTAGAGSGGSNGAGGGVAFADWTYELSAADAVAPPNSASPLSPPDELWAPDVRLRYAFAGSDAVPTTRPMAYLFARRGSHWYLASDDQLVDQGRTTWRAPWDYAPCVERTTGSGIVISHPGEEAAADRLARELDSAVRAVSEVWGDQWPQRVTVLLPSTLPELRAVVGSRFATDGIAAVAVADRVDRATRRVEGARVVLNPDTTANLSDSALRVVLRHEITHVAARASTVDGSPMWLLEGFADYVGYRDSGTSTAQAAPNLTRLLANEGPPADLPRNIDFQSTGAKLDLVYQLSWSVSRYVAQRSGEAKLVELYRRIAGTGKATDESVDAAFRSVLGIDRTEFLRGWRTYLRTSF